MPIHCQITTLPGASPGSNHHLKMHHFTPITGTRSAYIQAGLHADEHPGLLVVQHLLERLRTLEQAGEILGEIVVCPYANPIGLSQNILGYVTGRFNLANGENFNRNFPNVLPVLEQCLEASPLMPLAPPALKALLANLLASDTSQDSVAANKRILLHEALRHDVVLDLHCDTSAMLHLYSTNDQRERAVTLAGCMGIGVVLLEDEAGGQPFDESYNRPWRRLVQAGLATTEQQGFAASIELRGQADVSDELAREDAEGILRFLAHEGLLRLPSAARPTVDIHEFPLEGASHLQASASGILVWKKSLGAEVSRGELIAEIVPIDAPLATARVPVYSDVDGVILVQPLFKLVRTGQRVALLAGSKSLAHRKSGQLLQHF